MRRLSAWISSWRVGGLASDLLGIVELVDQDGSAWRALALLRGRNRLVPCTDRSHQADHQEAASRSESPPRHKTHDVDPLN